MLMPNGDTNGVRNYACGERITVSTLNGADSVLESLSSISRQTGVTIRWWIHDDGSTDSRRENLKDARSHTDVSSSAGSNKGVASSLLDCLQTCSTDPDFYAFCDQDRSMVNDTGLPLHATFRLTGPMLYSAPFFASPRQFGGDGYLTLLSAQAQYLALGITTSGIPIQLRVRYA
jgi:hypothetical protein